MRRNIYDFDKTIYDGDATLDFCFFCFKKKPIMLFLLPYYIYIVVQYKLKRISKKKFKEKFYIFLTYLPNVDLYIELFWRQKRYKIQEWYLKRKQNTDIIISASPYFLLLPICIELNVNLIASEVDKYSGLYHGENCYGEEKVIRLMKAFPDVEIGDFYSDSLSDLPLAKLSQNSYLVNKNKINKWNIES